MIWGEETPGRTDEFEAKRLTPAEFLDLESSRVIGVSATAPQVEAAGEDAGNLEAAAGSSRSAWRRRLAPRHRDAVKTFFDPGPAQGSDGHDR